MLRNSYLIYFISTLFGMGIPYVSGLFLAKILPVEDFGDFQFIVGAAALFAIMSSMGINANLSSKYFEKPIEQRQFFFQDCFLASVITMFLGVILLSLYGQFYFIIAVVGTCQFLNRLILLKFQLMKIPRIHLMVTSLSGLVYFSTLLSIIIVFSYSHFAILIASSSYLAVTLLVTAINSDLLSGIRKVFARCKGLGDLQWCYNQ